MTQQFSFWVIFWKKKDTKWKRYTHLYIHYSIIYKSRDTKANRCPWIDEWIKKYIYDEILDFHFLKVLLFVTTWIGLEGIVLKIW